MNQNEVIIRSEKVRDYAGIAAVHTEAFQNKSFTGEAVLVDMLRRRRRFDPELSIVAEKDGEIVAHCLLTPCTVWVEGEEVPTVFFAPVGVRPDHQGKGMGGRIIEEGIQRARKKGNALVFLLGHSRYYPRFGFHTHIFGTSRIAITVPAVSDLAVGLSERRVVPEDIPQLMSMWELWYSQGDFAVQPEQDLTEWISLASKFQYSVICCGSEVIGFVKYQTRKPSEITMLLSKDKSSASAILAFIQEKTDEPVESVLHLELHPKMAEMMIPFPFTIEQFHWEAAMAQVLDPEHAAAASYIREAEKKSRLAGPVHWPVEFDLMD
ncbi:GNAT family N-acetyltransferase [Gorillibacterium massiliense]|uniref:GNAT family N-acetyltransferase n=1 Tax=Gorillibacterium massiliense TaxID=1280390 RepID=UPI0004B702F2|nr:N-acetyltransferase [Gorillibacterium massiliense]